MSQRARFIYEIVSIGIALLCLLISLGYGVIAISAAALLSYLPLLLVLLLLWYFIRHFL